MFRAIASSLALAGCVGPLAPYQYPLEQDARIHKAVSAETIQFFARKIADGGYSCRSISSVQPDMRSLTLGNKVKRWFVSCNDHRYTYGVADLGGTWYAVPLN